MNKCNLKAGIGMIHVFVQGRKQNIIEIVFFFFARVPTIVNIVVLILITELLYCHVNEKKVIFKIFLLNILSCKYPIVCIYIRKLVRTKIMMCPHLSIYAFFR